MLLRRALIAASRSSVRWYSAPSAAGVPLNAGEPSSVPVGGQERTVSPQVQSLVEQIVQLPLAEVSDLNYALKKRLNIPDTPFMPAGFAVAAANAAAPTSAASEEGSNDSSAPQQISFAVKLTGFDDTKKIALIKQIRDVIPGLNLVQAKKFVEGIPVEVKNDLGKSEAEELKNVLEKVGGKVEIV